MQDNDVKHMNRLPSDVDALDVAILMLLQADGRMSHADVADAVGLSPSATLRRVRRLEQLGVIESYRMLVNRHAVGRGVSVFVEISLDSQAEEVLDAFEAAINDTPEVMSCHLMAGNADYLLHVMCADVADYESIHRTKIANLPHISTVRSNFAIRQVTSRTAFGLDSET